MNKYGKFKVGDIIFHRWGFDVDRWEVLQIVRIKVDDEIKNKNCSNIKYIYKILSNNNPATQRIRSSNSNYFLYNSVVYDECIKLNKDGWKEELMAKVI